jgi:hypothetical protein
MIDWRNSIGVQDVLLSTMNTASSLDGMPSRQRTRF